MKKLIFALSLALFTAGANAQVSVVTESGKASSETKINNIGTTVQKDLYVIEQKAEDWNDHVKSTTNNIDTSKGQLRLAVDYLKEKNNEFMLEEQDPVYKDSDKSKTSPTYRAYATKPVPACSGATPRLLWNGTDWKCAPRLNCNTVNGNQTDWREEIIDGKATCVKEKAGWFVAAWRACGSGTSAYRQIRTVQCKLFRDSDGNTPTGAVKNNDLCSSPMPITSRVCASN